MPKQSKSSGRAAISQQGAVADKNHVRNYLSIEQRSLPLEHTIDPGFVNRRAIQTILGSSGMSVIDDLIQRLPPSLPDWVQRVRIDHIYKDVLLKFCELNGIHTLANILAAGCGQMFCSTEILLACPRVYDDARVSHEIKPAGKSKFRVILEYSTEFVTSDTLRMELHRGGQLSVVAILSRKEGETLYFRPLVIGSPWLRTTDPTWTDYVMWWSRDFFEHFVEDFDEFSEVRSIDKPKSIEDMQHVSEKNFKMCLAKILGDRVVKDWGGEQSDHYTAHIHLDGRRTTAAFLLKGPAKFTPMTLNHLGKNNDQIFRLAQEPAEVLFVQHSHDITPAVRATLRAFAVQPGRARRYCLIDGRDSLWLLNAYNLLGEAKVLG